MWFLGQRDRSGPHKNQMGSTYPWKAHADKALLLLWYKLFSNYYYYFSQFYLAKFEAFKIFMSHHFYVFLYENDKNIYFCRSIYLIVCCKSIMFLQQCLVLRCVLISYLKYHLILVR